MKFESQDYTSFIFICNKNSSHLALSIIVKLCLLQSDLPTLPGGCVVQVVPKMSIYSWCNMFSSRSDQGIEPKQFSQIKFTIIQTTQPMSRYPTRKTIVFLAAIISMKNQLVQRLGHKPHQAECIKLGLTTRFS